VFSHRTLGGERGGFRAALFRADGSVHIWLDPGVVARLKALRGPGESHSDVILRLAKARRREG
jgi:hypothetical protein